MLAVVERESFGRLYEQLRNDGRTLNALSILAITTLEREIF
jgi:hypothetical protein